MTGGYFPEGLWFAQLGKLVKGGSGFSALCSASARLRPLVIEDKEAKTSRILVEPHLIGAEFCMDWMPYFRRSGHRVVTADQLLDFVDPLLPQEPILGSA